MCILVPLCGRVFNFFRRRLPIYSSFKLAQREKLYPTTKNPSNVHAVYLLVIKQYFVAKTFPLTHPFLSVSAVARISQLACGEWNS